MNTGRWVNGRSGDSNFFAVGWGVAGGINRRLVDSVFLAVGGLWTGRVYSGVDVNFFTV